MGLVAPNLDDLGARIIELDKYATVGITEVASGGVKLRIGHRSAHSFSITFQLDLSLCLRPTLFVNFDLVLAFITLRSVCWALNSAFEMRERSLFGLERLAPVLFA